MSLLEQDTIKKRRVDNKALPEPEKKVEFEAKSNKKYKTKTIINSAGTVNRQTATKCSGLYYFIL